MEREFRQLRHTIEHKRAREARDTFEVIFARHALALYDGSNPDDLRSVVDDLVAKLDFVTATIGGDTFRTIIVQVAKDYLVTRRPDALQQMDKLLSALYLPHARSRVGEMRRLVIDYAYFATLASKAGARRMAGKGDDFVAAWNALLMGTELGLWLDKTL